MLRKPSVILSEMSTVQYNKVFKKYDKALKKVATKLVVMRDYMAMQSNAPFTKVAKDLKDAVRSIEKAKSDFTPPLKLTPKDMYGESKSQKMTGYKVMRFEKGRAIAGVDSRQSFVPKKGTVVTMRGNGIYLGTNKQYVLDYYSELADSEILLTLEFDPKDITFGDPNDREVELAVKKVKIVNIKRL